MTVSERAAFAPCPICRQYSHSIGEAKLAEAFRHFEMMYAHPVRGHPMGRVFEDKTRDLAQVLVAAALSNREAVDALKVIAEGDEPRPLGKHWRADCKPSKNDRCTHGVWMYETCGECIAEFALAAIRNLSKEG